MASSPSPHPRLGRGDRPKPYVIDTPADEEMHDKHAAGIFSSINFPNINFREVLFETDLIRVSTDMIERFGRRWL